MTSLQSSTPVLLDDAYDDLENFVEQESDQNLAVLDLPAPSSQDPFDYYFKYPYLSLEQEQDLAKKFIETGCLKAAHQLVLSHMRYVVKLSRNYLSYGLPLHDLVQEGAVGLMKAVQRFNPYQGVRLVSFAVHWIKSEIHEYIIKNWRLVKIATTKAQRKLFFNLRRLISQKQQNLSSDNSLEKNLPLLRQWHQEVAQELDVPVEDVEHMAQRFHDQEIAFDQPTHQDDEGTSLAYILPAATLNPLEEVSAEKDSIRNQKDLEGALLQLSSRDQAIIKERFYQEKKATFKELAERYGVSVERVRQIEKAALDKLKKLINIQLNPAF